MSVNQPAFCTNCGKPGLYKIEYERLCLRAVTCSKECYKDLYWKNILCIMNKEYYPQPKETNNGTPV